MDQFFFMPDRHDASFCAVRYITDVRLREWRAYLQPLAAREWRRGARGGFVATAHTTPACAASKLRPQQARSSTHSRPC